MHTSDTDTTLWAHTWTATTSELIRDASVFSVKACKKCLFVSLRLGLEQAASGTFFFMQHSEYVTRSVCCWRRSVAAAHLISQINENLVVKGKIVTCLTCRLCDKTVRHPDQLIGPLTPNFRQRTRSCCRLRKAHFCSAAALLLHSQELIKSFCTLFNCWKALRQWTGNRCFERLWVLCNNVSAEVYFAAFGEVIGMWLLLLLLC